MFHRVGFRLNAPAALVVGSVLLFGAAFLASEGRAGEAGPVWQEFKGGRRAPLPRKTEGRNGFSLISSTTSGISFTNRVADRTIAYNRIYENGSGVALGDVDGDGWCDLYFCQLEGPNALYRNLGEWRFEDVAEKAGVSCPDQYSTGAVFADVDGDVDLDLLVNSIGGGTRLFLNDGKGRFTELKGTRLVRRFGSTSLSLADIDGDQDLDLYVTNYRTDTYLDRPPGLKVEARLEGGKIVVTPAGRFVPIKPQGGGVQVVELGDRDFLYVNDGSGRFAPASWNSGAFLDEDGRALTEVPLDWGLSVLFRDLAGDPGPDIYVCNDFFYSPDRFYVGEASSRFRAIRLNALRNMSVSSMAGDAADLNRDGHMDFFIVDMVSRHHTDRHRQRPNMMKGIVEQPLSNPDFRPEVARNTLFLNLGDGDFAEIAQVSGLAMTEWTWSVAFLDVDLDGYEDALIANGNHHDVQDADVLREVGMTRDTETPEQRLARFPRLETENLAFRNKGDLTFRDLSAEWGFNLKGVSQGMALGDLDNDGDLDVVLNNMNMMASLLENQTVQPLIAVRLKGIRPNSHGIGAKIKVFGGPVPMQSQEMVCGSRYVSCDDAMRTFAASKDGSKMRIEVEWRSGKRSVCEGVEGNRIYEIDEGMADAVTPAPPASGQEWFEDVSQLLGHRHVDEAFDDFGAQPLLDRRLSQLGPGLAWDDLDGDGWEELVVGAGRTGRLTIFQADGRGGFSKAEQTLAAQDQTAILTWPEGGRLGVLYGVASYEDGLGRKASVYRSSLVKQPEEAIAAIDFSIGPMAMADVEGDGDLDLFVGGRLSPGRYPEPAASRLYVNEGGKFVVDQKNSALFLKKGLVSGAVFSDLDGDGDCELALACEWGPVRVFHNDRGRFRETTHEFGLDKLTGWWNGITAGDFDGDGRLDLAVSNWGRNTKYQPALGQPLRLYYGDFDQKGGLELIEACFDVELKKIVPYRDFDTVSQALPFIREKVGTFRAYGQASVEELLGEKWKTSVEYQASTLDSMMFLNRGDRFEPRPLPVEAQFAPAFGLSVGDFNGDGAEDLFLAQNFFGVEPDASRYDGGRGLLLAGDGKGGMASVAGRTSGIRIYGEQRGCAAADYDRDGRLDLAVGQNSGATKLYRNTQAALGVRVRLVGPGGNSRGVGAVLRIRRGGKLGPAREIHGGSGFLSQDSSVQVLAGGEGAEIVVRWPGGKETVTPVEAGAKEVIIRGP